MIRFVCFGLLLSLLSGTSPAQVRLPFQPFQKRVEADVNKSYQITNDHGPWLILVTTFAGEGAEQRAKALALELRRDHRLKAYTHKTTIDLDQPVEGITWSEQVDKETKNLRRQKMKNLNGGVFDEISVLVGDFHSVEDPQASKTLSRIKSLRNLKAYNVSKSRSTNQFISVMRQLVNLNHKKSEKKGPFRAAFMIPNPTLPESFFKGDTIDRFVIKLNKDAKYSLMSCSKPYSVRVATFRGDVSFNLQEIEDKKKEFQLKKLMGGRMKSKLVIAAEKAVKLTEALRKRKIEAYVFHDRNESYVCVGSFEWVGQPRRDGKQEINRQVLKVIEMYKAIDAKIPGLAGVLQPRYLPELKDVPFDMQPIAVKVPQVSAVNRMMLNR